MIEARKNELYLAFFSWYSQLLMKWHFRSVQIHGHLIESDHSLLVIANHFSWWDGFIVQYLNQKVFKKNFHFMMLEEQLKTRMFLNKCGGFSVSKNPKELARSLLHAADLLRDPKNMVLIFPQGRIETAYRFPLRFERGIEEILKRTTPEVRLIFITNLTDYFSHRKPSLNIYYMQPKMGTLHTREKIEAAYNDFYRQSVEKQKEL